MSLLSKVKSLLSPKAREVAAIDDVLETTVPEVTVVEEVPEPPKRHGKIIKATKRAEYSPIHKGKGGVIRRMPKQLQQVKESQEMPVANE